MGYQHGRTAPTVLTAVQFEEVRRRNVAMKRELAFLTIENTRLQEEIDARRADVSQARRVLSRKVRDLAVVRTQVEQLTAVFVSSLPEPLYGGREGLEAAAAEIAEHEERKDAMGRRTRKRSGNSHGTRKKYDEGCRCITCMGWRKRKSERERVAQGLRRAAQRKAAA
jgi:hypothetical protein